MVLNKSKHYGHAFDGNYHLGSCLPIVLNYANLKDDFSAWDAV